MTRFLIHVIFLFILGCGAIRSSAALSLDDKVKELESRLENKIIQLEEKVTQLETQLEQNNQDKEELAAQVAELKSKVHQQETILSAVLNEKNELKASSTHLNDLINTHQSEVAINGLPSSCGDLKIIGHTLNGFYFVIGNKTMESVYCDFSKIPSDAGFQKWIGYTDVKSVPVYFYVQRNSNFDIRGVPIPFDLALVNEGNAMDLTSGIFTAPVTGIYFFSFAGLASSSKIAPYNLLLGVGFYLNGVYSGVGYTADENIAASQYFSPLTIQSTLNLKKGDQVWAGIVAMGSGSFLADNSIHFNHFTGFMMEEEIVSSL